MAQLDWLADLSPSVAMQAEQAIRSQLQILVKFPQFGRAINSEERKLPIDYGRDGFVAIYRIEPNRVVIARIFHGRQYRENIPTVR